MDAHLISSFISVFLTYMITLQHFYSLPTHVTPKKKYAWSIWLTGVNIVVVKALPQYLTFITRIK